MLTFFGDTLGSAKFVLACYLMVIISDLWYEETIN